MTQASNQAVPTQASARLESKATNKGTRRLVPIRSDPAKNTQQGVRDNHRESTERLVQTADTVTKVWYETIDISRGAMDACMECGDVTAAFAKDMGRETFDCANETLADNMERARALFACRTIGDVLELQNVFVESTMDSVFNHWANLSNLIYEYSAEVLQPINERVAQGSEKLIKALQE